MKTPVEPFVHAEEVARAVPSTEDPERAAISNEARSLVLEALESIPDDRRGVFIACELDELSARDVATALGIPLGTVRSRLRAARAEFSHAARRLLAHGRPPE